LNEPDAEYVAVDDDQRSYSSNGLETSVFVTHYATQSPLEGITARKGYSTFSASQEQS